MKHDKKPLLLQLSIPFCVRQCAYCSYPYCAYDPQVVRSYGKALLEEIEGYTGVFPDYEVQAISIEGGTPALLGADTLAKALRLVRRTFSCMNDVQISLQTMPGNYSRALMERMRDAGVNFWIVGLETAVLAEHEILERPYKFDAVTMVDTAVRTFEPRALSFDLLAGIPGQTRQTLTESLKKILYYRPDHVTIYPLELKDGCRMANALRAKAAETGSLHPHPATQELAAFAGEYLKAHDFIQYTRFDYGRNGCVNRCRLLQLQGCEYLGLGYHGASYIDGVMWHNGHSLQEYIDHSAEFEVTAADVIRPDEKSLQKMRKAREQMLV